MLRRSLLLAAVCLPVGFGLKADPVKASPATLPKEVETVTDHYRTLPAQAQLIRDAGDTMRADGIDNIVSGSELLSVIPFMDVPGGAYSYVQEGCLPGVAFVGNVEPAGRSVGVVNPRIERLKIASCDWDLKPDLVTSHGEGLRVASDKLKARFQGYHLADIFINGDPKRDPKEPLGLKHRFVGDQALNLRGTRLKVDQLDAAIDAVDYPTHIVCSRKTRNRLAASRALSDRITWERVNQPNGTRSRAAFLRISNDRETRKLRIVCTDYNDRNEEIISLDEDGQGTTSLYILSLSDFGVLGLQNNPPELDDLGLVQEYLIGSNVVWTVPIEQVTPSIRRLNVHSSIWRTRMEWLFSPAVLSGRAGARLYGFQSEKSIIL